MFAGLSDEKIMVQALIFALVGNGNMAYLVAFTAYNQAVHAQTQTRLQAEIDRTFPGKVSLNCRLTVAFLFSSWLSIYKKRSIGPPVSNNLRGAATDETWTWWQRRRGCTRLVIA